MNSEKPIRVLIADDHLIVQEGLVLLLKNVPHIEIVTTASNGEEVLQKMSSYYVDVLLLDIQMPVLDGFETATIITKKYPDTKIIILSMHNERIYIEKMYAAGVAGYLLKSTGKEEIVNAIKKVYLGGKYFSQEVMSAVIKKENSATNNQSFHLTKREKEIITLIYFGFSNPSMAEKLFLSIDTIKTHRKNIMRKLELNNTADLVKFAIDNSLTYLEP